MEAKRIYLVGGAVRDRLMGRPVQDRDYVAVGYAPEAFTHLKQVGRDFPVFLREDGSELALARTERKTGRGYNGFSVDVGGVSLEADLMRRDLTINAIAYDEEHKRYIDPFNGRDDMEKKLLRHTSEAFAEDPLRVLRLARFRATFGEEWSIHASTKVLVFGMHASLKELQPDRVWKEVEKVLALENSALFFETLFELGVLDAVFPSLYALSALKEGTRYHREGSLFIHTMTVLGALKTASPLLKLTALYHDIAKPHCYRTYGNGSNHEDPALVAPLIDMQIPGKLKKRMLFLIENHVRITLFGEMRASKKAAFLEGFKKERALLLDLIRFNEADNVGRIAETPQKPIDAVKMLKAYDAIASYSPKAWIEAQEHTPDGNAIAGHIRRYNVNAVKKIR